MAQKWIYEYDAKKLFAKYMDTQYSWIQVKSHSDLELLDSKKKYVIKPDQLFWKRWKYWLLWINLDSQEVKQRFSDHNNVIVHLDRFSWALTNFLVEEFVAHQQEYYISCSCYRDYDELCFSAAWWIDVEENRNHVQKLRIWVSDDISVNMISTSFSIENNLIQTFILSFYNFFKSYWFSYLEINPFVIQWNQIRYLDMVAKIDTCEYFKQKEHRGKLHIPVAFWSKEYPIEKEIEELDEKTWASLKLSILNPDGCIRLLLWWWGASIIVMDTLASRNLTSKIGNYGELSWNPSLEYNIKYTTLLIKQMLQSKTLFPKTLCIYGWISNFTLIDKQFLWIIKAIEEHKEDFISQNINILVRRWWVNDTKALTHFSSFCKQNWINAEIYSGENFLTEPLRTFNFKC